MATQDDISTSAEETLNKHDIGMSADGADRGSDYYEQINQGKPDSPQHGFTDDIDDTDRTLGDA